MRFTKSSHSPAYATMMTALVQARATAGVTQVTLAQRLGISQSLLSKYERRELRLDAVQVLYWCRALDMPFAEFARSLDERIPNRN